jgi:hypothetical protein
MPARASHISFTLLNAFENYWNKKEIIDWRIEEIDNI